MPDDPLKTADTLIARGDIARAIDIVAAAATAGDPDALFRQGMWYLTGSPLPRDLGKARGAFRRAATAGHMEADLIEMTFMANGTGGIADWAGARRALERASPSNGGAAVIAAVLSSMALDEGGAPASSPVIEPLAPDGSIARVPGLLTRDECAHLARSSADLLEPAVVVDPRTGRNLPHPIRTSDGAVIGPVREDLAIRAINRRIAVTSGTAIEQGEALAILRYSPGQQFRLHSDTLPHTRNQRIKTVLVYLNEGFVGGETVFPSHGITVTPRIGDGIVFTNVRADGTPDPRARHAGLPVTRGVKWLATRWIRARPFDVWTGPEAA